MIAAESSGRRGRPGEARRLAHARARASRRAAGRAVRGHAAELDLAGRRPPTAATAASRSRVAGCRAVAASAAAAEAFAGGQAALARGDATNAALRLGVAIRLEPGFAQGVLDAVGPRPAEPALALVAGDALRLLGRESEALAAFDVARGASPRPDASGAGAEPAVHGRAPEAASVEPVGERGDPTDGCSL